jgi:FtsP/CotA-like multicopper oxidase with cupredoxin domain/plastocyanin
MTTIGSGTTGSPPPGDDRSTLMFFAAFTSVAAFLLAALGLVAVVATGGSSATTAGAEPVAVTLSEFKITPSTISAPAGPVKLKVANTGSVAHNLTIAALNKKTADLNAGATDTLDLGTLKEGTYEVICNVPGHADSGMKATLVVGGSSSGESASGASAATHAAHSDTDYAAMDQKMKDGMAKGLETFTKGGATKGVGNQKLAPTIEADGTKVFTLESAIIDWETAPGTTVKAWAYNGMVPGPWIRTEPGDRVKVVLTNKLPVSTDIHFHGVSTPFKQDGIAPLTQDYINPGQTYTYQWTNPNHTELGMYHAHDHGATAVLNGMFAVFQVGDVPLPAAQRIAPFDVPAIGKPTYEKVTVLNDAGVIGLTLNGKSFPATEPVVMNPGESLLMHYYNEGLMAHPMHLHHVYQLVVAKDGLPLAQPYWADTLNIAPGERYSVLVMPKTEDIGVWAWHCHILNHAENDNGLFGMVTALIVNDPDKK